MWHASAQGYARRESLQIARQALKGVGDAALGEWKEDGTRGYIVHVKRRLTDLERQEFGVPEPIDIRGTSEEEARIAAVYAEAPGLMIP